jgi:O-antigen ligase
VDFPSVAKRAEILALILTGAALGLIQILIGGTRLIFSFPAYALLATVGLLTVCSLREPKRRSSELCLLSSAIFFGYILLRAFFSPVTYLARPDTYSVLAGLVVYSFIASVCTSARARTYLIFFLLSIAVVHVVIGAIQFRDGTNFMLIPSLERFDYGQRASGFYVCPNHLAGLLEVLAIFCVSLVCWSRLPHWSKLLIGYVGAVCFFGIVMTGSRGGFASTVAGLAVFAGLSLIVLRPARRRFWCAGGVGALAALAVASSLLFLVHRSDVLLQRAQVMSDSAQLRLDLWHAAIQQWKVQPWIGTGSGTYLYYGRLFRVDRMQQDPIDAHNDYLHLLAEYGLVGGVLFVLFLSAHLRNGWKDFRRLGPKCVSDVTGLLSNTLALNLGALASVAAYMVHSFVDFNLHIPANVLLLAFVFGILANAGVRPETKDSPAPSSIPGWRLLLPILGMILAVQSYRLLPGEYFGERARTAVRDEQTDTAIAFASRGLTSEKENPNLYQYLASALFARCDEISNSQDRVQCSQAPLSALEKARALAPQDRVILVQLALAYDAVGRYPEGEWAFYEAQKWDPRSTYLNQIYKFHLSQWQTGSEQNSDD